MRTAGAVGGVGQRRISDPGGVGAGLAPAPAYGGPARGAPTILNDVLRRCFLDGLCVEAGVRLLERRHDVELAGVRAGVVRAVGLGGRQEELVPAVAVDVARAYGGAQPVALFSAD